jgi:hypothetical protein
MRFDHAVWASMDRLSGAEYMQHLLFDRAQRFAGALDAAGIPYAVCGGMAVIAWISRADRAYTRGTSDVDVCLYRSDLERAIDALRPVGFEFAEVYDVPMFLDGPGTSVKDAVHILFAGEPIAGGNPGLVPELGRGERYEQFPWRHLDLESLLVMKLQADRFHDRTHVADLWRSGAIDRSWVSRMPEHLRDRLSAWLDECERQYGRSPH